MSEAWQLHRDTIPVGLEVHVTEIRSPHAGPTGPIQHLHICIQSQKPIFWYWNQEAQRQAQGTYDQVPSILADLGKGYEYP